MRRGKWGGWDWAGLGGAVRSQTTRRDLKNKQKGDGERGNTFELKTNAKPGRAIERFVIKQNTQRDTERDRE